MLPKNLHRQRRMDRLRVYPDQAPDIVMANVLTTWRDQIVLGPIDGEGNEKGVTEGASLATEESSGLTLGGHGPSQVNTV